MVQSVDGSLRYVDSGIVSLARGKDEPFQQYRERLLVFWVDNFSQIADFLDDKRVEMADRDFEFMFEVVPAIGFGQSGGAVQAQLAQAVATICQSLCEEWTYPWRQMTASSIKKSVCGYGDATKVQVRDAVIGLFPELEPRKRELTTVADESDAIAIAAVAAGYKVPKKKGKNPRKRGKK